MKVKINIDGGSRGNPGPGASAYVIKDSTGKILAQEGHFITYCTNNQAEYMALKLALIKSAELGADELSIQSDSLLLVKQYLGEYKIKHPDLAERMAELRLLSIKFKIIRLQHILRHLNKEPDALANKAMDAKHSVGYNPIKNLDINCHLAKKEEGKVNGIAVTPVKREAVKKTKTAVKKKSAQKTVQPDLFDEI